MGKARRGQGAGAEPGDGDAFFLRFRKELGKYADGVHWLGEPAPPEEIEAAAARSGLPLPEDFRSFLRSWNGAELFQETWVIAGVGENARGLVIGEASEETGTGSGEFDEEVIGWVGAVVEFARGADGSVVAFDGDGRVWRYDDDTGDVLVEATGFERWLNALMAREALVFDREGEYRDDVFEGEDFAPAVVIARERKAVEADDGAIGPRLRLARAYRRGDDAARARELLEAMAAEDDAPAVVLAELAQLDAAEGRSGEALAAATRALAAEPGIEPPARAAVLAAQAARWATLAGDEAAAKLWIDRAQKLSSTIVAILRDAGSYELEEGHPEIARELLEAAKLIAPRDLAVLELLGRITN